MVLDPSDIPLRDKLILSGLFLSKFDIIGLKALGFDGFVEAYNVIGFALGGKPASIKNYRDEFDPHFPNSRKGWHRRPLRVHCERLMNEYQGLDVKAFASLIGSFFDSETVEADKSTEDSDEQDSPFARRLITGLAAERYFERIQPTLPEFSGYIVQNTTRLGCGYDYRLQSKSDDSILAVEVKGLRETSGGISLTQKEYRVADKMMERFYLFVVKNFRESPFHEIFRNPLSSQLRFEKTERTIVHISWVAGV